ncbi:MAG: hypothetical protein NWP87_02815, partial [Winogradskyella sp.]|nr:hypothetical protein [Winogradskyella sp.]
GLGDGEAKVNVKNTYKLLIESVLRYSFLIFLLLGVFVNLLFLIVAIICLIGFKPYRYTYKQWRIFKSKKYNSAVFVEALKLIEMTRFNYLKGYLKGYNSTSEARIAGLKQFHENSKLS